MLKTRKSAVRDKDCVVVQPIIERGHFSCLVYAPNGTVYVLDSMKLFLADGLIDSQQAAMGHYDRQTFHCSEGDSTIVVDKSSCIPT